MRDLSATGGLTLGNNYSGNASLIELTSLDLQIGVAWPLLHPLGFGGTCDDSLGVKLV
jgi:hypothetical protein